MVLLDNSSMAPRVYYPLEHLMLDTVEEVAQNIFLFSRHTTWAFLLCVMWRAARGYYSPRISTCVQILWALYKAVLIQCIGYDWIYWVGVQYIWVLASSSITFYLCSTKRSQVPVVFGNWLSSKNDPSLQEWIFFIKLPTQMWSHT